MLCNWIVCGVQHEAVQRKLLLENQLILTRATEIAVTMETPTRNTSYLQLASTFEVNKIQFKKNSPTMPKWANPRVASPISE